MCLATSSPVDIQPPPALSGDGDVAGTGDDVDGGVASTGDDFADHSAGADNFVAGLVDWMEVLNVSMQHPGVYSHAIMKV